MQKDRSFSIVQFAKALKTIWNPAKACLLFAFVFFAASDVSAQNGLTGGARYRRDHTKFEKLPFDDGDITYFLMYEIGNEHAAWQIGADYAPRVTGLYGASADAKKTRDDAGGEEAPENLGEEVDYVITPQLNLVFKDRIFRAGTGVMASYIKKDDGDHEWHYPYWQMELGLEFNVGKNLRAGVSAYYLLDRWRDITKFRTDEIEYGARLAYSF